MIQQPKKNNLKLLLFKIYFVGFLDKKPICGFKTNETNDYAIYMTVFLLFNKLKFTCNIMKGEIINYNAR